MASTHNVKALNINRAEVIREKHLKEVRSTAVTNLTWIELQNKFAQFVQNAPLQTNKLAIETTKQRHSSCSHLLE